MSRLAFVILCSFTAILTAQQAVPAFEVVSIKRNVSGTGNFMGVQPGGRFSAINMSVRQVILRAFAVQSFQLVGESDRLQSERYDIQAKAPDGIAMTGDAINTMLQAMFADRFKLKVRRETRESPIYELVVGRSDRRLGEKLQQTSADCARDLGRGTQPDGALIGPNDAIPCGAMMIGGNRVAAGGQTMARLATMLAPRVQRIVVDKTDLAGLYNFDLQFQPDPLSPASTADGPIRMYVVANQVPPLMTAIQEQLGLKLQSARGPVEYVVIESLERPAED